MAPTRGKTTEGSTPGSFAPGGIGADNRAIVAGRFSDDDGDDDLNLWEDMEADSDDYDIAAQSALRMGGIPEKAFPPSGDIWWNDEEGVGDNIGFDSSFDVGDIDSDYLTDEQAAELKAVKADEPGRELHFASYTEGRGSLAADRNNYASVSLTDNERAAVLAHMEADEDENFADDMVDSWESGSPSHMQQTFGFVSVRKHGWEPVDEAVKAAAPKAWRAREFAAGMRQESCKQFEADTDHIGSDEWKKAEYEARNS